MLEIIDGFLDLSITPVNTFRPPSIPFNTPPYNPIYLVLAEGGSVFHDSSGN